MSTVLRIIELFLNIIPTGIALGIGSIIGLAGYFFDRKHRKLSISNILRALKVSPAKARIIAKKSFQNLGVNVIEFLINKDFPIEVEGREYVDIKKSHIFVLGHFGNWEFLGRTAVRNGLEITAVGRDIKNKGVNDYIKNRRLFSGLEILDKKGSFKYLLEALKKKRSAAILIDQYAGRRGVFVDFLGIPTSTTPSPVLLAMRTGSPVIPAFIIREGRRHKIIIEPPVEMTITKDISKDIRDNTQAIVRPLEKYVRLYPEQWWWVHRRWR